MDATTSAEVAGDSFRDLRVLLYDLRSPPAAARMGAELLIRLDLSEKQNQRVARNVLAATMRDEEILSDLALLLAAAANDEKQGCAISTECSRAMCTGAGSRSFAWGPPVRGGFWSAARQKRSEALT